MGLILSTDELSTTEGLPGDQVMMAAAVGERLFREYPGHNWFVTFDHGVMTVVHGSVRNSACFKIVTKEFGGIAAIEQKAKALAGEFLERFNVSRGAGGVQQMRELAAQPVMRMPDL